MLKNGKKVEMELFLHIMIFRKHLCSRDLCLDANDECMKGLERHKTCMFNEYVHKCFENARS